MFKVCLTILERLHQRENNATPSLPRITKKKNRFQNNGVRLQKMTSKVRKLNNITKKT